MSGTSYENLWEHDHVLLDHNFKLLDHEILLLFGKICSSGSNH